MSLTCNLSSLPCVSWQCSVKDPSDPYIAKFSTPIVVLSFLDWWEWMTTSHFVL